MMRYKAILFDFDGVIARTMEDNFSAWSYAFSQFGINIEEQEYFLMEGATTKDVAKTFSIRNNLDLDLSDQIVKAKERHYLENNRFSFYPGVEALIARLKRFNYRIGLVSGAGRTRLQNSGVDRFLEQFDVIVTGDDVAKGKPDPEPYLQAARRLALDPRDCLVVENAPLGIQSAKRAMMDCVAVCTTLGRDHLGEADRIIEKVSDLAAVLMPDAH